MLFVSPERFLNEEFLSVISSMSDILLVVDEAHCISEWWGVPLSFSSINVCTLKISCHILLLPCWSLEFEYFYRSHNFRPSFMRLRASLLHKKLKIGAILAMTATATTTTLDAIMSALDIPCINLIQKAQLRDNFHSSVSLVKNRQVRCFGFPLQPAYFPYLNFGKLIHQYWTFWI